MGEKILNQDSDFFKAQERECEKALSAELKNNVLLKDISTCYKS